MGACGHERSRSPISRSPVNCTRKSETLKSAATSEFLECQKSIRGRLLPLQATSPGLFLGLEKDARVTKTTTIAPCIIKVDRNDAFCIILTNKRRDTDDLEENVCGYIVKKLLRPLSPRRSHPYPPEEVAKKCCKVNRLSFFI